MPTEPHAAYPSDRSDLAGLILDDVLVFPHLDDQNGGTSANDSGGETNQNLLIQKHVRCVLDDDLLHVGHDLPFR